MVFEIHDAYIRLLLGPRLTLPRVRLDARQGGQAGTKIVRRFCQAGFSPPPLRRGALSPALLRFTTFYAIREPHKYRHQINYLCAVAKTFQTEFWIQEADESFWRLHHGTGSYVQTGRR